MLVNCVAYKDGNKIREISQSEISQFIQTPGCFVWVALYNPDPSEILEMQRHFNLHPLAVEDALHANQRPKLEEYGDSIFVAIHAFEMVGTNLKQGEVYLFAGTNYVLSIRHNYDKGFIEVRERCEREPHLLKLGSGFILYALVDTIVDRYFPMVERLENELEALEQQIFKQDSPRKNIELLYALKQKILTLRHATAALLEAMGKLYGGRVPSICHDTQEYFRDIIDHLYRINLAIENAREMLITAIQVNLTMISLGDSQISKRLAAWAAILATPTMIAGIYGMNFKHMPELDHQWGYPLTILTMILIDLYLYYRFKKAGWV